MIRINEFTIGQPNSEQGEQCDVDVKEINERQGDEED